MRRWGNWPGRRIWAARIADSAGLGAVLFVVLGGEVHAYVDPSTSGTLVQLLMGGVVASLLLLVRLSWNEIASKLGPKRRAVKARAADDSQSKR